MCVWVCVRERKKDNEREIKKEKEGKRWRKRWRKRERERAKMKLLEQDQQKDEMLLNWTKTIQKSALLSLAFLFPKDSLLINFDNGFLLCLSVNNKSIINCEINKKCKDFDHNLYYKSAKIITFCSTIVFDPYFCFKKGFFYLQKSIFRDWNW